jgi:hypothetical protein
MRSKHADAQGVSYSGRLRRDAELEPDIGEVTVCGVRTDVERVSDLAFAHATRNEPQHIELTLRQRCTSRLRGAAAEGAVACAGSVARSHECTTRRSRFVCEAGLLVEHGGVLQQCVRAIVLARCTGQDAGGGQCGSAQQRQLQGSGATLQLLQRAAAFIETIC